MPLALDAQQALWINFPTSLIRLLHLTAAAATSTRPTREHASTLCTVSRSLREGRTTALTPISEAQASGPTLQTRAGSA